MEAGSVTTGDIAIGGPANSGMRDLLNETSFGGSGIVNNPAPAGISLNTTTLALIVIAVAVVFFSRGK